jgi:hypothetical protein
MLLRLLLLLLLLLLQVPILTRLPRGLRSFQAVEGQSVQ